MFKFIFCFLFLLGVSNFSVLGDVLPTPKLTPQPSTEAQAKLLKEGKALHDQGEFDLAIAKYDAVLKENADNVTAIYEMAFSYAGKKEYGKSQELALKAAQYKTDILPDVYVLVGNNYDLQGDFEKAVKAYQFGIKQYPQEARIYFNLAVSQHNKGKIDDARKSLKQAVVADPNHLTSHLVLGQVYYNNDYNIPSLFALTRFLGTEPLSKRSGIAFPLVEKILAGNVQQKNPNEFTISVNVDEKKDEGDFSAISAVVGLLAAGKSTEKGKNLTELENLTSQFSTILSLLEQSEKKKATGFAQNYYTPFFAELYRRKYSEAFAYLAFQRKNPAEAKKWLEANQDKVTELRKWMAAYQWPKVKG